MLHFGAGWHQDRLGSRGHSPRCSGPRGSWDRVFLSSASSSPSTWPQYHQAEETQTQWRRQSFQGLHIYLLQLTSQASVSISRSSEVGQIDLMKLRSKNPTGNREGGIKCHWQNAFYKEDCLQSREDQDGGHEQVFWTTQKEGSIFQKKREKSFKNRVSSPGNQVYQAPQIPSELSTWHEDTTTYRSIRSWYGGLEKTETIKTK